MHPHLDGADVFVRDTGDGAIKGFGVRMKPSGAASYLVQYRTREGRTRRLVLGRVGVSPRTKRGCRPAKGAGHYTGLQKDWERVRVRARLPELRLHDLRHSSASFAVADGHTLFMVSKVLGHRQARTTEGYAHLAPDPLRTVADRTAARIAAAMKGGSDDVETVPLPRQG